MGNMSTTTIKRKGKMVIKLTYGKKFTLMNVFHVFVIRKNLISCSLLNNKSFQIVFESNKIQENKAFFYRLSDSKLMVGNV